MENEFEIEWYRSMWWMAESVKSRARRAADACWDKKEAMLESRIKKSEPDTELLVDLFLLLDIMNHEELRSELEMLKDRFYDIYEMRHRPLIEDEEEE